MGKKAVAKQEEAAPPAEAPPAAEAIAAALATQEDEAPVDAGSYDLTTKMTPYLDLHLILKLLSFLKEAGHYDVADVTQAEDVLLQTTGMIDVIMDRYTSNDQEVPEGLNVRREEVWEELQSKLKKVYPLLEMLEDSDRVARVQNFKSILEMCDEFELEPEMIDEFLAYAKMTYHCGQYQASRDLLKHYRNTFPQAEAPTAKLVSCIWGSLACDLLGDGDESSELILKLDELLETTKAPKRDVLLQRVWLLHWSLFAMFSSSKKVDPKIPDFFLNEKSLSIISLACPHLFRYVSASLILNKRLKHLVKDTVWMINHESGGYSDPITRFLLALYTEMDFEQAQHELTRCELVCKGDHFLAPHWTEFQENARLHIFESYCRTHQCINIGMIASKLNMEATEAELWIVKLIQNAKLDARIDSEKSRVVMTKAPPNVYQQVIEKTKNLAFRSTMLVSNLEKK